MTTILVDVSLALDGKDSIPVTSRSGVAHLVVDWYYEQTEFLAKFYHLQILSIIFSRDDEKLFISYARLPECDESPEVINTCLADPDDDGNHPLRIGNQNYLVIGMI